MSERHVPHDEHLRTALRHAPDAELAAPPDVSAQILAAAHRAAAEPLPKAAPKRPWWAFESPKRWGASGAFATVLLAGMVGVLWHGQQTPGPATDAWNEAAAPVAAPAAAPPASSPAPAPLAAAKPGVEASAFAPAPEPQPPAAVARSQVSSTQALRQSQEQQRQAQARAEESKREAARETARMDESRRVDLHKERPATQRPRDEAAGAAAPAPVPASPPPPPPVLAQAPVAESVAPAAPAAPAAVVADANPPRAARSAPAGMGSALMARPRPNGPWMDALAAGAQVQWSIDGEARAPTSSWLYALAEQTQGRWRAAPSPQLQAGDTIVQWQRGETLLGRLWLGNERVLWCDAQGRCEEAALAADVTSALRNNLKGLAR